MMRFEDQFRIPKEEDQVGREVDCWKNALDLPFTPGNGIYRILFEFRFHLPRKRVYVPRKFCATNTLLTDTSMAQVSRFP